MESVKFDVMETVKEKRKAGEIYRKRMNGK